MVFRVRCAKRTSRNGTKRTIPSRAKSLCPRVTTTGRLLGRGKAPSLEVLPGREVAPASRRRCRVRQPRRACLPHGQRILFPKGRGHLGRRQGHHQDAVSSLAEGLFMKGTDLRALFSCDAISVRPGRHVFPLCFLVSGSYPPTAP